MKERKRIRLGHTCLYSGYVKLNDAGELEPEAESLFPLRNMVLVAPQMVKNESARDIRDGVTPTLASWISGPDGLLRPMSGDTGEARSTAVRYWADQAHVHLIPSQVVLSAWAVAGKSWPAKLAEAIQQKLGVQRGIIIQEMQVKKQHLRPPDRNSEDPDEKLYATAYDKLSTRAPAIAGLVLPRMRAVVVTFSDLRFEKWIVALTPPNGEKALKAIVGIVDSVAYAVVVGTDKTLPVGLYKIEVNPVESGQKLGTGWSSAVAASRAYTLHEMLHFQIINAIGELDVVCGDPISVEEAVMAQFPVLYERNAKAAARRVFREEQETESRTFPVALKPWAERMSWTHSKAKLAVGVINADGTDARAKLLGKAIWSWIKPDDDRLKAMKEGVDLAFGIHGAYGEWKEVLKLIEVDKEALKNIKRLLWTDDSLKCFERYRWWKYAKQKFIDEKVMVFDLAVAAKDQAVLKAGIPSKRTKLQELIGDRKGAKLEKSLAVMGGAIEVLNTALAFNELFSAKENAEHVKSEFERLLKQVDSLLHRGASREGLGNLERMRTAAVAAELGVDEAEGKALMASIDLVLGALTMVGIGGPATALVAAVKTTTGLLVDAAEALDRHVLNSAGKEEFFSQLKTYEFARASRINQSLMPKEVRGDGKDDLALQYPLRAEVLTGFVKLLIRANMDAKNNEEYLKGVQELDVKGYVQQMVLGDRWQYPLNPSVPIGLDSIWLQLRGFFRKELATTSIGDLLGRVKPLKLVEDTLLSCGKPMPAVFDQVKQGQVVANYQKSFPLHRMDAAKFEDLAMAFRPQHRELNMHNILCSRVYYRAAGAESSAEWKPVCPPNVSRAKDLPLLSPLDQVRVLLVMNSNVKSGQYPVSFRLRRRDGWPVDGPVYPELLKVLEEKDLLPTEKEHVGKIGCVFYPFYCFGSQIIPGIKPIIAEVWRKCLVEASDLASMRYDFEVIFDSGSVSRSLGIGVPTHFFGSHNEFRVGITGKPEEEKLLTRSFLFRQSHQVEPLKMYDEYAGAEPCYARVGERPYVLATPEEDANRVFADFNWRDPVEIVLVVWTDRPAHRDAEKEGLEWDRVNVEMQLVNFVGTPDQDGPVYDSSLEYVGMLKKPVGGGVPLMLRDYYEDWNEKGESHSHSVRSAGPEVKAWADQVFNNPLELKKFASAVDPVWSAKKVDYYIYAAHFRLDYYTPSGKRHESLRPFGKVLISQSTVPNKGDNYYRIGIRNIRTRDTGLVCSKIEAPAIHSLLRSEYEFHFRAPSVGATTPWSGTDSEVVDTWITRDATVRHPKLELLAKAAAEKR